MKPDDYARIARHAALGQHDLLLDAIGSAGDPEELAELLRRHHLLDLVSAVLREALARHPTADPSPPWIAPLLASRKPAARVSIDALVDAYREVDQVFRAGSIDLMMLKGIYFAERLYGGIDRRPQYDLDLLIRPRDTPAALGALAKLGFAPKWRDFHSHTLARGPVYIDLHHAPRRAPVYSFDEDALWRRAREARAGGIAFRTLADGDYLAMLAASMFEDVGFGKGNSKQALDLYLLLSDNDARMNWAEYFRDTPRALLAPVANVLALVADVFAVDGELGHFWAALDRRLVVHRDRREALDLLFAPRGRVENMLWFGRLYPGSVLYYRLRFWLRTFPGNLRNLNADWVRRNAALLLRTRSSR